jgi:hypothetical protein
MMIDNSELIKPFFYFNENNSMFFHCQIVKRAKDHPGEKIKEKTIQSYFIKSIDLDSLLPEIKLLCDFYGARAYINVSGKYFSKVNYLILKKLAKYIYDGNIGVDSERCMNSAAGKIKSKYPYWVIDIDTKDKSISTRIYDWVDMYFLSQSEQKFISLIPIVQGFHLLTPPLDSKLFTNTFPDVSIHKNSMVTLLYMPDLNK